MASASVSAPVAGAGAGGGKDEELADLVRRLMDALARYADRLPFDLDRQVRARICDLHLRSVDAFLTSPCLVAWDLLGPAAQRRRLVWERLYSEYYCLGSVVLFSGKILGSQSSSI
jgi:hypothetical protein